MIASDGLKFQFATDGEGNHGYLGADGSLIPFKSKLTLVGEITTVSNSANTSSTLNISSYKGYEKLSVEDFFLRLKYTKCWSNGSSNWLRNDFTYSYDATTGILTIYSKYTTANGSYNTQCTFDVYAML